MDFPTFPSHLFFLLKDLIWTLSPRCGISVVQIFLLPSSEFRNLNNQRLHKGQYTLDRPPLPETVANNGLLGLCNFSRSSCSGVIHEIAERLQFIQSGQLTIVAQIGGPLFVSESLSSAIELLPAIAAVKRLLVLWAPLRFLVWWSVVYLEPNIPTAFYSSYIGSGAILPGPSSFSIGTG